MKAPQEPERKVVRVVLELDVVLTAPTPDQDIPGPVTRLLERLVAGRAEDRDFLQTTACHAACLWLDDQSELGKEVLGTVRLEELIPESLERSPTEDRRWFDRILKLEGERDARRSRVPEGWYLQNPVPECDGLEPPDDPDVLNDEKGWFDEVETFLRDHWSAKVVGIHAQSYGIAEEAVLTDGLPDSSRN